MNILLVLPNSRTYVKQPNLGLGYLAASLGKEKNKVFILDMVKEKYGQRQFQSYLRSGNFDVVGFYMFSQDYTNMHALVSIVREEVPKAVTIVGGPHPTGDPMGTLDDFPKMDYIMQGYGEIGFPKLIQCIEQGSLGNKELSEIDGLGWRNETGSVHVNPNENNFDIDAIGFPRWDLMRPDEYPNAPHGGFIKQFPYAPIMITRGCPMSCTFCSGANGKIMKRSVDNVMDELRYLKKTFGVREILIEDENFTIIKGLCREFCEALLRENAGFTWNCASGVRLDTLNMDDLRLMEKAGCHSLSVGIEFGSQRIHDLTKKRLNLDMIKQKLNELSNTNIRVTGFFLMGMPEETEEDIRATVNLSLKLKIHRAQFNNFMPLPGSEIWSELEKKGELANINFNKYFVHDVPYVPKGLTVGKLKRMQREAYLRFYMRWRILKYIIKDIGSMSQLRHLLFRFLDALK